MAQNKPEKVLFLITKATWGGAQRYVYDLASHLPGEYESHVAYGARGRLAELLEKSRIPIHKIPDLGRDIAVISDISSFFRILVLLFRLRPDIIHLNSSKAAALGALAARLVRAKKIIFTVHGWPFKEHRNEIARMLMYCASWLTAAASHAVIVVSKQDEALAKRMPIVRNKVHNVPLGISPIQFLPREEAIASLSIPEGRNIVTVAELAPNKGIRYAIEAIAELEKRDAHVSYFVIGEGEERGRLESFARSMHVSDRVHFLGFRPDAARYLKAFDAFLLPSTKEGSPYVLLEAAAAGLPVLATEAVDENFDLRVPAHDPEALADGIQKILKTSPANSARRTLSDMVSATIALY
ncbi:MAG: hypothetical protein RLZZ416_496 [Candidatus Parcubacteria bacterium]|jgi:glycosyltransferase involved in cell wall biosynthesis